MDNVTTFLKLQKRVNQQIALHGIANFDDADRLEVLGDSLTAEESDEVCKRGDETKVD